MALAAGFAAVFVSGCASVFAAGSASAFASGFAAGSASAFRFRIGVQPCFGRCYCRCDRLCFGPFFRRCDRRCLCRRYRLRIVSLWLIISSHHLYSLRLCVGLSFSELPDICFLRLPVPSAAACSLVALGSMIESFLSCQNVGFSRPDLQLLSRRDDRTLSSIASSLAVSMSSCTFIWRSSTSSF